MAMSDPRSEYKAVSKHLYHTTGGGDRMVNRELLVAAITNAIHAFAGINRNDITLEKWRPHDCLSFVRIDCLRPS